MVGLTGRVSLWFCHRRTRRWCESSHFTIFIVKETSQRPVLPHQKCLTFFTILSRETMLRLIWTEMLNNAIRGTALQIAKKTPSNSSNSRHTRSVIDGPLRLRQDIVRPILPTHPPIRYLTNKLPPCLTRSGSSRSAKSSTSSASSRTTPSIPAWTTGEYGHVLALARWRWPFCFGCAMLKSHALSVWARCYHHLSVEGYIPVPCDIPCAHVSIAD